MISSRQTVWLVLISSLAFIGLFALSLIRSEQTEFSVLQSAAPAGATAANFEGVMIGGSETSAKEENFFSSDSLTDKYVLISFRASWCAPCKREAVFMESLYQEYKAQNVEFLAINIWEPESDARKFAEEYPVSFPVILDAKRRIHVDYGIRGLPTMLLLSPDLRIFKRYDGELSENNLKELLDLLVNSDG